MVIVVIPGAHDDREVLRRNVVSDDLQESLSLDGNSVIPILRVPGLLERRNVLRCTAVVDKPL